MDNRVALAAEQGRESLSSTAAHTPGPWSHSQGGTLPIYIATKDGRWKHVPGTLIAEVGARLSIGTGDFQEDLANARLIAAAPDMLAALELVNAFAKDEQTSGDDDLWIDHFREVFEVARAAIAKATGANTP